MSRLVDYFTVVSYGSTLDPFAPPVFDVDGAAGAGEVASAAAAVGTTRSAPQQPQPDQLSDNSQSKTYKEETETQQRHHTPTSASRGTNITPSVSSPNSNSSVLGVPCVPSPSPSLSPNPPVDLSRFHPSSSQRPTPSPTSSANLSSSPPSISRHLRPYSPASESRGTQPAISPKLADDAAQASNQHAATDSDSTSATQLTDINPTPLPSPPMVPPDLNLVVSPVGASPAPAIHSHFATAAESRAHLTPTYKHQTITTPHESNKPTQITEAKQTPLLLLSFNERLYRSKVVDRFPAVDHRSVPFPPGIAMFAMPDDITLTIVPALPIFYFFACTGVNGVRLYGSCLRFAEPLPAHMAEQVWAEEIIVQENKRKSKQDGREHTSHTKKEDAHSARSHPSPSASASASTSASAAVSSHPTPTHSSEPDSTSLYSYCLLPPNRRPPIYASKCLCLLSTYPFLRQFRDFLTCFYRRSLTPSPIPLERVIANFMQEVPLPPIGQVKVQYLLGDMCITFARPPSNNPFGFRPFPVRFLFQLLDFAHVMLLFECLLAEKRILLVSHSLSSLTVVSETLLSLMYPFVWQHVLIPLLPKSLIDFLHAPFPFIIGMHASYIDTASLHGDILDDLVIVDLDRNHVDLPGPTTRRPPGLPHKEKKKLWAKLKVLKLWRAPDARSAYETKCLDNMDLAFTNAPCPNEVELVERGRLDVVQALLEKEVLKNQNCSPSLARRARLESVSSGGGGNGNVSGVGGGVRFSSGLHTMAHRTSGSTGSSRSGGGGGPIDPKRCKTNITSPSALEFGLKDADLPDSPSNQEMMQADPPSLFECTPEGDSVDYLISSAFFRVFVSILKDYRPFLIFPSASNPVPDPCFDIPGFIKSVEGNSSRGSSGVEPFLREMCKTQAFRKFVEERTFPITGKEQQERLTFFDESILSKRNRSKIIGKKFETPFLADRSNDLNKTFVAPSPDASDLPLGETYVYSLFPTLDLALFSKPRISSAPFLIIQQSRRHQLNTARIAQRDRSRGSLSSKKSHASRKPSGSRRSSVRSGLMSSPDQVVMTLWFVLFTSIIGENRDARALDTAFQLLINMRRNGLQPEEEIFPCLMFACGACGQPERAIDVLREMTNNGFQPDANTYAALLQVFTMDGDHRGAEALACLKSNPSSPVTGGSLVSSLKRELAARGTPNYAKWNPTIGGESSGVVPVELDAQTHYQHPFDPNDPSSPCASPQPLKLTEMKESERINMFQLQFQMLFPSLEIRTEEECPECGKQVLDQYGNRAHAATCTDACWHEENTPMTHLTPLVLFDSLLLSVTFAMVGRVTLMITRPYVPSAPSALLLVSVSFRNPGCHTPHRHARITRMHKHTRMVHRQHHKPMRYHLTRAH